MEYWQGIVVTTAVIAVFFAFFAGVAFLRRNRNSRADDWQDDMAMRASEFVNRHGGI